MLFINVFGHLLKNSNYLRKQSLCKWQLCDWLFATLTLQFETWIWGVILKLSPLKEVFEYGLFFQNNFWSIGNMQKQKNFGISLVMCPLIQLHQILEELEKLDQVKYNSTTQPFSGAANRPGVFLLRQWISEELINSILSEKTACKTYFMNLNRLEDKNKNVDLTGDFSDMIEDKSSHWWQQKVEFSTGFAISKYFFVLLTW